jgi:hypothetical protein
MLFLLNQRVLDLSAPGETLQSLAGEDTLHQISGMQALTSAKAAVFNAGSVEQMTPQEQLKMACSLAIFTDANAVVLLVPQGARSPHHVASRLARVGLTTLAWLDEMQKDNRVTPAMINANVWAHTAA